ncbi:MAG TPA: hypothetical protein EYF98_15665 [Planctomycetes bacterium]|nr:hypothetical protein [Planctomycetota bacterium]
MSFGGKTYLPHRDYARLNSQLKRVFDVMRDGEWHTLPAIKVATGDPMDASVSARIRDFRKKKFGGFVVESECISGGLWRYRLRAPEAEGLKLTNTEKWRLAAQVEVLRFMAAHHENCTCCCNELRDIITTQIEALTQLRDQDVARAKALRAEQAARKLAELD